MFWGVEELKAVHCIAKGQLISEWLFGVLNVPKNNEKIWWISALESRKYVVESKR